MCIRDRNTTDYSTLTLGATLRVEHYQAFRKPTPTRDKLHEKHTTALVKTTTTHFQEAMAKTDYSTQTLGATLHADQHMSFRKPPPTRDKLQEPHTTAWTTANQVQVMTTTDYSTLTLGATHRVEHYQAFRRPPPTHNKLQDPTIT